MFVGPPLAGTESWQLPGVGQCEPAHDLRIPLKSDSTQLRHRALNYLANVLAPDALQLLLAHIESLEPARSADDLGCTLGAIPFLDLKSAQRVWTRLRQLEGQAVTLAGAAAAHPTFAVQLAKEFATDTALGTDRRGVALQAHWLSMHPDRVELFVRLLRDAARRELPACVEAVEALARILGGDPALKNELIDRVKGSAGGK